jgi:uncharacterized protein (DUF111 family)
MKTSIVIRTPSGLSGDMLVTGLSRLAQVSNAELNAMADTIGLPALHDVVDVRAHHVEQISGWRAHIDLPHEHHHRTLRDITDLIEASAMEPAAKRIAAQAFSCLGKAEAQVHNIALEDVSFHEVGALDSILDTCLSAILLARLAPARVHCSPLPLCDGVIRCAHGPLASPAPAVQEMLRGIPVYGIASKGETVTPTALAFLRAADAHFGKWPQVQIVDVARAYGGRVLPGVPNGAMFFLVQE